MHDQPRTHAAGLQRDVQRTVGKSIVTDARRRLTDRDHLGVGAGVVAGDRTVEASAYDFAVLYHHSTHRNLARPRPFGGKRQGLLHEELVQGTVDDHGSFH